MNRMKTTILLLAILLIAATPIFAVSVEGQSNVVSIKFKGLAAGKCFIGYGGPGPGHPDPYEWWGIGKGNTGISGRAETVPLEGTYIDALGDAYVAEYVEAQGDISTSWIEEDGSKHRLIARLYSTASTGLGVFVPDANCFSVPLGGQPGTILKALRFEGIHASGSEIQRIDGIALFSAWPLGFSPVSPPTSVIAIEVFLLDENTETLYIALWLNEQVMLPISGFGTSPSILVPAAQVFQHKVEIKSSL